MSSSSLSFSTFQEAKYASAELAFAYLRALHRRPVLTKALTSAVIAGLGDVIYQLTRIAMTTSTTTKREQQNYDPPMTTTIERNLKLNWRSVGAFAGCGLFLTGPVTHYFYILLDKAIPADRKLASIRRLLVDRLLFAPVYMLLMLYVRHILEGLSHREAKRKVFRTYLTILQMSFRVWTIAQYINLNHVPQQYRVLFSNMVALGWNVYLASMKTKKGKF